MSSPLAVCSPALADWPFFCVIFNQTVRPLSKKPRPESLRIKPLRRNRCGFLHIFHFPGGFEKEQLLAVHPPKCLPPLVSDTHFAIFEIFGLPPPAASAFSGVQSALDYKRATTLSPVDHSSICFVPSHRGIERAPQRKVGHHPD